jgi:hypothetical protein
MTAPRLDPVGDRISSPPPDFARFNPIPRDSRSKPHDTRAILHDPRTKTHDFDPKLNDIRCVMFDICAAIS